MPINVPIPGAVHSFLGPVPVTTEDLDDPSCAETGATLGEWRPSTRSIHIHDTQDATEQWRSLMHEIVHLALHDSGQRHILSAKQEEAVCDALGTYLTSAVASGFLSIKTQ